MKRMITLMLALLAMLALMLCSTAFAETCTDACGESVTWTLNEEGVLTISGEGAMTVYDNISDAPWYSYGASILSIVIDEGVTSISNAAFHNYASLTSVVIPDSVTEIGVNTFSGCYALEAVTFIGEDMPVIGYDAIPTTAAIVCHTESEVELWARENGYKVEPIVIPTATPAAKSAAVHASDDVVVSITTSSSNVQAGDEVTVQVSFDTAIEEGIGNFTFQLCYDPDMLTFVSGSNGGAFGTAVVNNRTDKKFVAYAATSTSGVKSGSLFTVVFKVNENAASGTTALTITDGEATTPSDTLHSIAVNASSSIAIAGKPTPEPTATPVPTPHPDSYLDAAYLDGTLFWTLNESCDSYDLYVYAEGELLSDSTPLLADLTETSGSCEIELDSALAYRVTAKCAHDHQATSLIYIINTELTLPDSLTAVKEEAFANTDVERVFVPDYVTEIGPRAFANCASLHYVVFEGDSITIAEDAFEGCGYVVFVCAEDSDAAIYSAASNQFGRVNK